MNLSEIFTPKAIAANWTEVNSNRIPYLGSGLFPNRKKAGLDLSWIKGHRGLPISLAPSTFDAKARFRDPIKAEKTETEMPFFREGYLIKEKDRQEILRVQDSNDPYAITVVDQIFDGARDLLDGALVVPERMIWQLLAPTNGTPGISIVANGVDYTYNYDPNGEWKSNNYITVTNKWNVAASADPLGDLQAAISAAQEARGTELAYAVMSRKTFNYMMKADSVKSAILAQNQTANIIMTDSVLKNVVSSLLGINIVVYDKQYKDENGTAKKFMPDDAVVLIPRGPLGSTWRGTTPEEADLLNGSTADVAIVNDGIAIARIITPHPVNVEIYASEIVLPSFERMDEVMVLKVV